MNNNLFDVLVMMVMGLVGFAMLRFEFPAAPFLIAFVLGPLLEDDFRQSLLLSDGAAGIFFRSGIRIDFWALTAITAGFMIWNHVKPKKADGDFSGAAG